MKPENKKENTTGRKSRVTQAAKPDAKTPAKLVPFEPPTASAPTANAETGEQFDPGAVLDQQNIWWQNGTKKYFRPTTDGKEWISVGEQSIRRTLRLAGVKTRAPEGASFSQSDLVMARIEDTRHVDFSGSIAGFRPGLHHVQDRPIIVLGSYKLIEPVKGDWPRMQALHEGMFKNSGHDQLSVIYAHEKIAYETLRDETRRGGHALILVGPSDSGKSFFQEHIFGPIIGGRSADPTMYMLGKSVFNAELLGSEHLQIQELPSGLDHKSRAFLGEQIKRLVANEGHLCHAKGADAFTAYPFWRLSCSINRSPERLKSLPPFDPDFVNKVLIPIVNPHGPHLPAGIDEQPAFLKEIRAELPAFLYDLINNWQIPFDRRKTKFAGRFGQDHFLHEEIAEDLFEQEPEYALRYVIDEWLELPWGPDSSMKLEKELTEDACPHHAKARKLFSFQGAAGTYLSKLADKYPERFVKTHKSKGNVWTIHPDETLP